MTMNFYFSLALMSLLTLPLRADERDLYKDSIKATKQSIARETLDSFYHDGLDYYHDHRYDDALQLFDKIYSIDPQYENVASLRETIRKNQRAKVSEQTLDSARDWLKKGDRAKEEGKSVLAISYWKQALQIDPTFTPAKKKIEAVNQALAKKEFEAGYIHYHHGEMEDALESWSEAVALDPTYKQRGLLLLMSKVDLQVHKDQVQRLAAQGFDQYQQGHAQDALQTYQELIKIEPRHEEARRMASKIKVQIGQSALKSAHDALSKRAYPEAIQQADLAILNGYETSRAQEIQKEAKRALELANRPRPAPPKKSPVMVSTSTPSPTHTEPTAPAVPAEPANPEEAMAHYRQGMAAIRKKDFHLALDQLDSAYKLDPSNERIYMARERARQEWAATSASQTTP